MRRRIGIVGGTGLDAWGAGEELVLETRHGDVTLTRERHGAVETFFAPRHGRHHETPPHRINSRALVRAFQAAHVDYLLGTFNVGSLDPSIRAGSYLLPDDFLDETRQRVATFHDDAAVHVGMVEPFCPTLRDALRSTAKGTVRPEGVVAAVEGPRFETAAEARRLRAAGAHVVGMTAVPEVVLAREAGLCYAAICFVGDGSGQDSDVRAIQAALARRRPALRDWVDRAGRRLPAQKACACASQAERARLNPIRQGGPR